MKETKDPFLQVVDQLAIWKFLPAGRDRAVLSMKLEEWCDGKLDRAKWLTTQVDLFDEYPGPATLRKMIKDKFQPAGALATFESSGAPPQPVCTKCTGSGVVRMSDDAYGWCSCEIALQLQIDNPGWLDLTNSFRPSPESELRANIRAAAVARKLSELYGEDGAA